MIITQIGRPSRSDRARDSIAKMLTMAFLVVVLAAACFWQAWTALRVTTDFSNLPAYAGWCGAGIVLVGLSTLMLGAAYNDSRDL